VPRKTVGWVATVHLAFYRFSEFFASLANVHTG
jgi:hypothetical protein